jgi:hypothetical protein
VTIAEECRWRSQRRSTGHDGEQPAPPPAEERDWRAYGRAAAVLAREQHQPAARAGATLTAGGEIVQVVLRLAGPLFFGLALLALRGRVKR